MRISIAHRELIPLWNLMANAPVFGGGEDALMAQMELWEAFGFDDARFTGALTMDGQGIDPAKLDGEIRDYELSPNATAILRNALASQGQGLALAKRSHAAILRIRAEEARIKAEAEAKVKDATESNPGSPAAA